MKTQETTASKETKQLESQGNSFLPPRQFSFADGDAPTDGGGTKSRGKTPEPKLNIKLSETWGEETIVPGMTLLGSMVHYAAPDQPISRYILAGTAKQWSEVLRYTDDDSVFSTFVSGFLIACTDPAQLAPKHDGSSNYGRSTAVRRLPNNAEKLEFLKALYGVDVENGNQNLDLVDDMYEEGLLGGPGLDFTSPLLAAFIAQNQTMLIHYVSSKVEGALLSTGQVGVLADQGTRNSFNPHVVRAMVQNAYATAVATAKLALADAAKSDSDKNALQQENVTDMVRNSATIIKSAIDAHGKRIGSIKEGAGKCFDEAWGLIPIPSVPGLNMLVDSGKEKLKAGFIDSANGLQSMEGMKEKMTIDYHDILKASLAKIVKVGGASLDQSKLTSEFNDLIEAFKP